MRPALLIPSQSLQPTNTSLLQPRLQICTFLFNNFHDAPPATSFFSIFCIVARGSWVSLLPLFHLPTCELSSISLVFFRLRTFSPQSSAATSLRSIVCALFPMQRRGRSLLWSRKGEIG